MGIIVGMGDRGFGPGIMEARRFFMPRGTFDWMGASGFEAKGVGKIVDRAPLRWIDNVASIGKRERVSLPKHIEAPRLKGPAESASVDIEKSLDKYKPTAPNIGSTNGKGNAPRWWVGPAKLGAYGGAIAIGGAGVGYAATQAGKGVSDLSKPIAEIPKDVGNGVGEGVYGLLGGLGGGLRTGATETASGLADATKTLLLPALLIGGGILLFGALRK